MEPAVPPGIDLTADQGPKIRGAVVSTWALSVVFVLLRFLSRYLARAGFWWDDWLILSSPLLGSPLSLLSSTWYLQHGFGKHVWAAAPDIVPVFFKGLIVAEIFFAAAIVSIKGSILLSYRRVFKVKYMANATTIVGVILLVWFIACVLVVCLQCIPLRGYWDRSVEARCGVDTRNYFLGKSIPHTVTDIIILCMPMYPVWKLHIAKTQKAMLMLTFLTGGLVIIVSIVRLVILLRLDLHSPDITWNFVSYLIWTCVELNIGTIAACLPCLRPLLVYFRQSTGLTTHKSPSTNAAGTSASGQSDQIPLAAIKVQHDVVVESREHPSSQ